MDPGENDEKQINDEKNHSASLALRCHLLKTKFDILGFLLAC